MDTIRSLFGTAMCAMLVGIIAGCGGRGELEEGIPKDAFASTPPPLTDAQKQMKDKMAGQSGPAATTGRQYSDAQKAMMERMKQQGK